MSTDVKITKITKSVEWQTIVSMVAFKLCSSVYVILLVPSYFSTFAVHLANHNSNSDPYLTLDEL